MLEVGCGNGWVSREIARRVGRSGGAVGLDPSAELLAVARREAELEGVRLDLQPGDARALPFADGEFDVALAPLVLLHVPDPERAAVELVRVIRPGGLVGVLERDNESFIINHPDRALTRRIIQVGTDQTAISAWIGRQLPGLLTRLGLENVQIRPFIQLDRHSDAPGSVLRFISRWADTATELGAITTEERQRWFDQLSAEEARGGFLAGVTHLFIWGRKPAE